MKLSTLLKALRKCERLAFQYQPRRTGTGGFADRLRLADKIEKRILERYYNLAEDEYVDGFSAGRRHERDYPIEK